MPTRKELVAHGRSEDEIAKEIGADCVIFQELDNLIESVSRFNPELKTFDVSVFTGKYVTGDITSNYLAKLEKSRGEEEKGSKEGLIETDVIGLHNSFQDTL